LDQAREKAERRTDLLLILHPEIFDLFFKSSDLRPQTCAFVSFITASSSQREIREEIKQSH